MAHAFLSSLASRRAALLTGTAAIAATATGRSLDAKEPPALRVGVLVFGSVQWVASTILRHHLDRSHGFDLRLVKLANNDTARIALLGGSADIVVSDWLFVAAERARGIKLRFAAFSSATGAVVLGRHTVAHSLKDLAGKRLGVAGGPYDKSWMIIRAAARRKYGVDLARAASIAYGAPPLLNGKLEQGGLDAVLTYWNYAAALEVDGFQPLISVSDCAATLGLPPHPPILGYVFHGAWAAKDRQLVDGFLAAARQAESILLHSDAEWNAVRPLMHAPNERLFVLLRERFRAGIVSVDATAEEKTADRLFAIIRAEGGSSATGGLDRMPSGVFWGATA